MATARSRRNTARRPAVDTHARAAIWVACFASLAWIPGGFSRFVFAKLLVLAAACILGALAPRSGRLPRPITWTLLAGAALFAIAALASATPLASLVGRWPRYEGVPMLGMYAAAAWLGARVAGHRTRAAKELVRALAASGWVLFAFSAFDALGVSPLGPSSNGTRTGSILGNATDQGLVAMMTILVLAPVALDTRDRYLTASTVAAMGTLALSGSRMPLIVTVLGLIAIALLHNRRLIRPVAAALGTLVLVVLVLPESRDRLLSSATVSGRWLQWKLTAPIVGDHPFLGIGPSRYVDVFGRYETHRWVKFTGIRTYADSPHDVVLQVWLAGGIPLLIAACTLAFFVARIGLRQARTSPLGFGLLVAVSGYAVAMLANFTVASSTCLAAFLAGALLADKVSSDESEPTWWRPTAVGAATMAAVILFVGCVSEISLQRGMTAAARGDLSTAQKDFTTARHLRPLDVDTPMLEAQALASLANSGDRAAASLTETLANQSLRHTPTTYASLLAEGTGLLTLNQPQAALAVFTTLTHDYPMRPDGFIQRGIARFGTGDQAGARADLKHAHWIAPHYRLPRQVLRRLNASH